MTINALALELIRSHSEDSTDTTYVLVVETWIRDSLSEINSATRWEYSRAVESFSTVVGVSDYLLPPGLGEIELLRTVSPRQTIEYLHSPEFLAIRGFDFVQKDRPLYWSFVDDDVSTGEQTFKIRLFPTPSSILSIERFGIYNIANLLTTSQIPLQADKIATLLKDRVRAYMLEHDKDYEGSDRSYQRFIGNLRLAVDRLNMKPRANINSRMQVSDIRNTSEPMARLDPSHFGN